MSDTLAETGVDDWWMYPENIDMVLDWLTLSSLCVSRGSSLTGISRRACMFVPSRST